MIIRDVCPRCKSSTYKKNGHIHNGKQNYQCKDYGRQFVQCFEQPRVSLVRASLSFSKKLAHHIGAIKCFICHYNLTKSTV